MINPTTKVYRKQVVEGFSIPAIIHNGSYFFVDIDVYADGRVDCWNFEDLEHFKKDVSRGWVTLSIPDNKEISIHGLGNWTITNGSWLFNEESFIAHVLNLIKALNPTMENIYHYREKVVKGVRIGDSANGSIYKERKSSPNDLFPEKINGSSVHLFYKVEDEYYLTRVVVFPDSTISLDRLKEPVNITLAELEELVNKGIIVAAVPAGSKVNIHGLGSFTIHKEQYSTDIEDKLLEIQDLIRELRGEPSLVEVCRAAYQQYLNDPTVGNKEQLKISYEAVPDHHKRYVGDMDTKDTAVRMIIYGEQEIENWSHYRVAKAMGEEKLPTIKVPKPKDEHDA
ncbi:DUF7638 domain-containing protein [Chitinophaga varians]|uniref:DUF7638 domain-containing protein n=1 Tax=Chitinophaga varians TaxID=2202339 RepID=UPI00165F849D|nr:hypothetical protein [Chitinophaga varians]MBC9914317.1 hypothetical protein [Chitinophaga varians]